MAFFMGKPERKGFSSFETSGQPVSKEWMDGGGIRRAIQERGSLLLLHLVLFVPEDPLVALNSLFFFFFTFRSHLPVLLSPPRVDGHVVMPKVMPKP